MAISWWPSKVPVPPRKIHNPSQWTVLQAFHEVTNLNWMGLYNDGNAGCQKLKHEFIFSNMSCRNFRPIWGSVSTVPNNGSNWTVLITWNGKFPVTLQAWERMEERKVGISQILDDGGLQLGIYSNVDPKLFAGCYNFFFPKYSTIAFSPYMAADCRKKSKCYCFVAWISS